ncbi:heavy metal translocating P-type ATPase [Oxalobacteraceae bacterium R-40]|uniref:P-type Zn(2+) transporter n=2 Tax=Keguizhuia sedimenti TaxID=3064264 RepID=A0ABU1BTE8_9BURK|nr:heavy metal translocating P-type ATPase [Oxalobacteraceae bacterium R-40]
MAPTQPNRFDVLTLRIEKMDCPTEEALLRKKIGGMPGIDDMSFNLMQRRLTVKHRLADPTSILLAIESLDMQAVVEEDTQIQAAEVAVFTIDNMDCPTEEALIRKKLGTMTGVTSLDFNLMQRKLTVSHNLPDSQPIQAALHAIGMNAVVQSEQHPKAEQVPSHGLSKKTWWKMGIAAMCALGAEIVAYSTGNETSPAVLALVLAAILLSGLDTYKKGWVALKNRNLNINALMSIAVTGAILIGQWPEAAVVMFLFTLAEAIEVLALDRARNAIRSLMAMAPERATVQQADGSWRDIDAEQVGIGMIVRVKPGERIPLDGQLTAGQSAVNQAPITGESIPVAKAVGDAVFAGTINETGSFEYRVTSDASHSTLSRIIKAVEEAQGSRAPTQRFVDQFSKVYTPAVFLIALLVAVVPPLVFGQDWMDWIYKALVLLVIACPCALVISTPVTVVSGLAAAARRGILIKGGVYLEEGRKLRSLAFDKTGTITQGKPAVTDVVPLQGEKQESLRLAASLASRSDHPVSSAVSVYWKEQGGGELADITDFAAITGRGVKGRIGDQWLYLGNHRLVEELGICNAETEGVLEKLEAEGKTVIVICSEKAPLLVVGVADTVRETSRQAIKELHALGVRTVMLTGDNPHTAKVIAANVGIDDARGSLLPEDKLQAIEAEIAAHHSVGMVGDGINDAPALAKAQIGFAMGAAGTDTAIETADVALMDDDLRKIPQFIRLSRQTGVILKQNIALALGIKVVFFILAFMGVATLWMAVFADMGGSLLVVANGLRLLKVRFEHTEYT